MSVDTALQLHQQVHPAPRFLKSTLHGCNCCTWPSLQVTSVFTASILTGPAWDWAPPMVLRTGRCFANMIGRIGDRDFDQQDGSTKGPSRILGTSLTSRVVIFLVRLPDRVRVPFMEDPKTGLVNSFLLDAIRKHLCSSSKRSPIAPSWRYWSTQVWQAICLFLQCHLADSLLE